MFKNVLLGILFGVLGIIFIGIITGLISTYFVKINHVTTLANRGIATTATILEYRNSGGKGAHHHYTIYYNNQVSKIDLPSGDYPVNSKIPVLYDGDNLNVVMMGKPGDNAWELYKANNELLEAIFFGLILILSGQFLFIYPLIRKSLH